MRAVVLTFACLVVMSGCGSPMSAADEKAAIVKLVQSTYGGSVGEVSIDPVVVRMKYGVADWAQGETGGRALVHKEGGGWKVIAAAGEEMRDVDFLRKAGVPELEAKALVNALIATERPIAEERLAKFDRYGAAKTKIAGN